MAGYQTIQALRPILHRGPVPMPVVNRALVRPHEFVEPQAGYKGRQGVRMPEAVIAEIVSRRESGESYLKIRTELGVSMWAVKRYAGHVKPPNGRWPNAIENGARTVTVRNKPFAERLRRAGFTYREIGEELNCSASAAWHLIAGSKPKTAPRNPIYRTLLRVERATGIPRKALKKDATGFSCRLRDLAKARHIAFWILRNGQDDFSYYRVGKAMGGYDHTSVLHGCRKVDAVVSALHINLNSKPLKIAQALWAADWSEVSQ